MMTAEQQPLQIPLLPTEPLSPLPASREHYVPAVQNKKGELAALEHASEEAWLKMTPLIQLVGPLTTRTEPFLATTVDGWMKRVGAAVGERPIYLDVMRLDPTSPVSRRGETAVTPILSEIYIAARRRRIRFVPVAWVGQSTKRHLGIVAAAAAADGWGVALRYRMFDVAQAVGTTRVGLLREMLSLLGVSAQSADLLLDLGFLSQDEDYDARSLAAAIATMAEIDWRSIVVLGTAMPKMLGCIEEGTVGELPRQEWDLWNELIECELPREVAFGDYAIQHPLPPQGGGPGMRANIRYTTRDRTLVARGQGSVLEEGAGQYKELCQQLVERREYAGRDFSWGDRIIDDCAMGRIPPGAQGLWRGAGTSHHLRLVTDQLRELAKQP